MNTFSQEIQLEELTEISSIAGVLPNNQSERPVNHPSVCCCTAASAKEVSPTMFDGLS